MIRITFYLIVYNENLRKKQTHCEEAYEVRLILPPTIHNDFVYLLNTDPVPFREKLTPTTTFGIL